MSNGDQDWKTKLRAVRRRICSFLEETIVDLSSLEVNSVLVSNISADHPSTDREYLWQTCIDLADWFERNKIDSSVQTPLDLNNDPFLQLRKLCDENKLAESDGKIGQLYTEVDRCLKHKKPEGLGATQSRDRSEYRRHLRYLKKYLDLYCSDKWNSDKKMLEGREHLQLRKLWELVGTKYIYAQTVLDLDGDIMSRVNNQLFSERDGKAEELMRFHKWNVEGGVNYRNGLMNTFVQIIKTLIGRFL
jgi:hypothetical protein